jgi:hypothetical protein
LSTPWGTTHPGERGRGPAAGGELAAESGSEGFALKVAGAIGKREDDHPWVRPGDADAQGSFQIVAVEDQKDQQTQEGGHR